MAAKRYTVAVDFDGVIHSYTTPYNHLDPTEVPDPPVPGAIEWLNEIRKDFEVIIFTTRGDHPARISAVQLWLAKWGYEDPWPTVTNQKLPALVYIDDRALRFDGSNFPTRKQIHRLIPWNKPQSRQWCTPGLDPLSVQDPAHWTTQETFPVRELGSFYRVCLDHLRQSTIVGTLKPR